MSLGVIGPFFTLAKKSHFVNCKNTSVFQDALDIKMYILIPDIEMFRERKTCMCVFIKMMTCNYN